MPARMKMVERIIIMAIILSPYPCSIGDLPGIGFPLEDDSRTCRMMIWSEDVKASYILHQMGRK
jgi:hypothetical protein